MNPSGNVANTKVGQRDKNAARSKVGKPWKDMWPLVHGVKKETNTQCGR